MTEREHGRGEGREPLDEQAAWAQIVAGYGAEPPDPPGVWAKAEARDEPREAETGAEPGPEPGAESGAQPGAESGPAERAAAEPEKDGSGDGEGDGLARETREPRGDGGGAGDAPVRSFTVYAAGTGPRDWEPAEAPEAEDHFVPPEPPPLPEADTATKFAWLAVLGGPALLLAAVLFGWDVTWWMTTLGIGGFLGGFGTLVARMRDGREDDDFDDPGRGAVV
ncbi:hypothetical protein V1J52_10935 [Streptomyces sp. TRM 70351]|uniref:hypothetical protein n=1 Tax=Streptomyces sp. TRM 70351 TaxID=3116552 RepID=UPI002E7B79E1|nr:hypothetical protein [Streptomyces sp. TRM 70351]MEE1928705.1 hypothetical protein [Streptomyces sp. TRM 70351]